MATVVLGAFGTLVGGPIGGAIGALAGRALDSKIFGGNGREGPRLKELAVTTSSYGAPMPKHFGTMRVSGTIIWATDLQESRETSGGGKGKPKTTEYSYSMSFAVALGSRPIESIGRIWADGNLLRGASGDLKTGGDIRFYSGSGDQEPDPLMRAAIGVSCPAFRDCAYVVFEDLQLADFGNRIPALTFEVHAGSEPVTLSTLVDDVATPVISAINYPDLAGVSYEGGAIGQMVEILDSLYPMAASIGPSAIVMSTAVATDSVVLELQKNAAIGVEDDFGPAAGHQIERNDKRRRAPDAIRYYDVSRDYQPGVQRVDGMAGQTAGYTLEFPGAFSAQSAKSRIQSASKRYSWATERLRWRQIEIDPQLQPGVTVRIPNIAGLWIVDEWEWRETGIEIALRRAQPEIATPKPADGGVGSLAPDYIPSPTVFRGFELPWDGSGQSTERQIYAAAGGTSAHWKGAAIYAGQFGELVQIGSSGRSSSTIGVLASPLQGSDSLRFERDAALELEVLTAQAEFRSQTLTGIANGQNRILVDDEIIQFACAEQLDQTRWRLSGLLRGRGGTESQALRGHMAGSSVILLDEALIPLDPAKVPLTPATSLSAIGFNDPEPVTVAPLNQGLSLRPLSPVHACHEWLPDGSLRLRWTRRSRGAWQWPDNFEVPLHEDIESYQVGAGPIESPDISWTTSAAEFTLGPEILSASPGKTFWVQQIGRSGKSPATVLVTLD